ncbi:MAG: radical SAM protein [Gammaproteobacteria bacterium]|nr:radical SAM protein [Gammaproteobacteria bacterium]MBU1723645.1 radical SAM protein [Gammaproteobacteria bacterium]MBU2005641.1 radical SAM protein [Gammaproteobacteria bacterium]
MQVYSRIPATHALGPGKRYALWVQGCPFRCKGCLAPNSLPFEGGESIPIGQLAAEILSTPELEGITISGGEPFAQAAPLAQLTAWLQTVGLGIIVYSGYTLTSLQKQAQTDHGIRDFLTQIDLLIDGPYVENKDDGKSLRGSSNQQLHFLTDRYKAIAPEYYGLPQRQVEFHVQDDGLMMVGVPGKKALKKVTSS